MKGRSGRRVRAGIAPFRRWKAVEADKTSVPADELAFRLCSWLCHELSGPLGVLAGSLDLLDIPDEGVRAEARAMLAEAVDDMMNRLAFNRIAFGLARRGLAPHEWPEQAEWDESGCGEGLSNARSMVGDGQRPSLGLHGTESHRKRERLVHRKDNPNTDSFKQMQTAMDDRSGPSEMGLRAAASAGQSLSPEEILRILRGRFEPRYQIVWSAPQYLPRHEVRRLFLYVLALAARMPKGGRIEIVLETTHQGAAWQFETGEAELTARSNATSALCEALLDQLE